MNFNWCLKQLCSANVFGCDIRSETNIYLHTNKQMSFGSEEKSNEPRTM